MSKSRKSNSNQPELPLKAIVGSEPAHRNKPAGAGSGKKPVQRSATTGASAKREASAGSRSRKKSVQRTTTTDASAKPSTEASASRKSPTTRLSNTSKHPEKSTTARTPKTSKSSKASHPSEQSKDLKPRTNLKSTGSDLSGGVLIITGEHSGDLLGADVARELQKQGIRKLYGTGGKEMESAGVELLENIETMNVVGFVEALKAYRRLKALARSIVAFARKNGIRHAILVDYPGFNLRLAEMLKQDSSFFITYLVSPQLWAWHYSRIKVIKKYIDLMLPLFPFEEKMYKEEGVEAHCVGHPLVYRIGQQLKKQDPIPGFSGKTIGLLPGSRHSEIRRLLPPMLEAARQLKDKYGKIRFLLPGVNEEAQGYVQEQIDAYADLDIESMPGRSLRVMEASDLLILSSGTATMEAAFFGTPMVVLYKVGWINFLIISLVIRTRVIGMVNLLARRQAAVELLQTEVRPDTIFMHSSRILDNPSVQSEIRQELEFVKHSLGKGRPATEAARLFMDYARGKKGSK